jgi:hypothetical protein
MDTNSMSEESQVSIAILIYTTFRIVTGVLYLPPEVRLSDRLNVSKDDFIPLHDPRIIDLQQGWVEPVAERGPWFVHRREILILHEVSTFETRARVVGVPSERVPRCPHVIRAYLGSFRVEGTLHLPEDCDVASYLNRTVKPFLPLTAVQISLPVRDDLDVVHAPFALLNRSRLVISKQVEDDSLDESRS